MGRKGTGAQRVAARSTTSERLSVEDYAKVGLELLAESGLRGVTVATACARLGVTKGSFYHHFSGVADLHQAMLDYWVELYGQLRPAELAELPPMERLEALVEASVDRHHEVEAAIRTWSRSDERVAAVQHRLDDMRIAFAADALAALGVPAERGAVLAEMGLALLIGFQTRAVPIDRRLLRAAAAEWRDVLRAAVDDHASASATRPGASRGPAA